MPRHLSMGELVVPPQTAPIALRDALLCQSGDPKRARSRESGKVLQAITQLSCIYFEWVINIVSSKGCPLLSF